MRFVITIFLMALLFSCQNGNGAAKSYTPAAKKNKSEASKYPTSPVIDAKDIKYEDQNGKRVATYNGGLFTGVSKSQMSNGLVLSEETFVNGIKQGPYKINYASGKILKECSLVGADGNLEDGIYREYYESGQLKYQYHYKRGVKVGNWDSYYENGQQWTHRFFKSNQLDGEVLVWDETGLLTKKNLYDNGILRDKQFDPNGLK